MLAGRYPSDEFAELRPRVVWDRAAGVVRGRDDARRLAVTSGGTIPDRGLYGVFLADSGSARRRARRGDGLRGPLRARCSSSGATSWRIEQITRDRVLVSPAPGRAGRMPFWKGDGVGRPYELGRAVGEAARTRRFGDLDELAASNLTTYLDDQEAATGVIPSDRTIVVERFRDEIGDWRVCVLSPFGGRVHAPWALAVERRMGEALGIEVESLWADDGIAIRLPDSDTPPPVDLIAIPPDDLDDLLIDRVSREPALRGPLPRERGPRAPHPAPPPRAADAALAAAAEGARPAAGRAEVRLVPGPARDLPRGALGRLRGAGAEGPPARDRRRRGAPGRGRVGGAVAVRLVAPLRLHRDLHVRGRRAGGRAARPGAPARPRAARRAPADTTTCASCSTATRSDDVQRELQGEGRTLDADRTHDLLRRLGDLSRGRARGARRRRLSTISSRRGERPGFASRAASG